MQEINYKSTLFYKNMRSKPPKDLTPNSDYLQMVAWEKEKSVDGINVNGIFIPGTIYYALNHSYLDVEQPDGSLSMLLPTLRDTDWEIHTGYDEAKKAKKGFVMGSFRQGGKTSTLVTLCSHELFLKENAEVVALFSSDNDKQSFTKKFQNQMIYNTDFLVIPSLNKDFSSNNIRFGFKTKDNTVYKYSELFMLLTDEGRRTQVGAGKTTTMVIYDEIAKAPCKLVHEAIIPAFKSQLRGGGLRASPMYTFTGGDVKKGKDAKKIFENPEAFYFQSYGKEKTGFFLPGEYHGLYKKNSTFGEFIKGKYGKSFENEELDSMPMLVTDWEYAKAELDREEEEAFKTDIEAYTARKMYFPRNTKDIFISGDNNMFAHLYSELEKLLHYLEEVSKTYEVVDLIANENSIQAVPSTRPMLTTFPSENLNYKELDTGVVILSHPRYIRGQKLYVAGLDPYNVDKTSESTSLGSWYIMQRETADYTDPFNDRMVAYYNGRSDLKKFRTTLLNALRYYGAHVGAVSLLHEAADDTLTQWFDDKNLGYMLEDTYTLSREINPKTNTHNSKGLRPIINNQRYYLARLLEYLEEELPDGRLGLWRISDPYLVKQILSFDGDLSDKDAMVGFGHALAHLFKEKKFLRPIQTTDTEQVEVRRPRETRTVFGTILTRRGSVIK